MSVDLHDALYVLGLVLTALGSWLTGRTLERRNGHRKLADRDRALEAHEAEIERRGSLPPPDTGTGQKPDTPPR